MFRNSPGIKVCGLTEPDNALDCLRAGADWIGLNFHPGSPRCVAIDRAEAILSALPSRDVAVGLFVRMRLVETPKFAKVQEEGEVAKAPLLDVLTKDFKNFIVAVGLKLSEVAWVYVLIGFLVYYATSHLHLSKTVILDAVLYAAILELVTLPLFGLLSDYVGRKPLYIAGTILSMIAAFPLFTMVETKDPTTIAISIAIIMSVTHGLMFSPQAAFIPELFGTKVRYSGASLGVQVSAAISGGFAPMIATGLLAYYGTTHAISWYLIALGAITLIATLVSRETAFEDL